MMVSFWVLVLNLFAGKHRLFRHDTRDLLGCSQVLWHVPRIAKQLGLLDQVLELNIFFTCWEH